MSHSLPHFHLVQLLQPTSPRVSVIAISWGLCGFLFFWLMSVAFWIECWHSLCFQVTRIIPPGKEGFISYKSTEVWIDLNILKFWLLKIKLFFINFTSYYEGILIEEKRYFKSKVFCSIMYSSAFHNGMILKCSVKLRANTAWETVLSL